MSVVPVAAMMLFFATSAATLSVSEHWICAMPHKLEPSLAKLPSLLGKGIDASASALAPYGRLPLVRQPLKIPFVRQRRFCALTLP